MLPDGPGAIRTRDLLLRREPASVARRHSPLEFCRNAVQQHGATRANGTTGGTTEVVGRLVFSVNALSAAPRWKPPRLYLVDDIPWRVHDADYCDFKVSGDGWVTRRRRVGTS